MRTLPALPCLLLALTASRGCKESSVSKEDAPGQAADAICGAVFGCMCETRFASEEACHTETEAEVQAAVDEGVAAGLTYDGHCAAENIDDIHDLDCDSAYDLFVAGAIGPDNDGGQPPCKAFHGTGALGDPCTSLTLSNGDSCQAELSCSDAGTCIDPTARPDELEAGEPCSLTGEDFCGEGLLCGDPEGDGQPVCVQSPGLGEACIPGRLGCGDEGHCDTTEQRCIAWPGPSDPCLPAGGGPRCDLFTAYCGADDVCVALPGPTEPCLQPTLSLLPCEPYLECAEGLCQEPEPAVCPLYADATGP